MSCNRICYDKDSILFGYEDCEDCPGRDVQVHNKAADILFKRITELETDNSVYKNSNIELTALNTTLYSRISELEAENATLKAKLEYFSDKNTEYLNELWDLKKENALLKRTITPEMIKQVLDSIEELDGEMPDQMFFAMKKADKDTMTEALRIVVRQTKKEISDKLNELMEEK